MEGLLFSEGKGEGVDGSDVERGREERREGGKTVIGLEKIIDQLIKKKCFEASPHFQFSFFFMPGVEASAQFSAPADMMSSLIPLEPEVKMNSFFQK